MSHIAIDARIINSSTGTYVERLLHYLQQIDNTNTYSVLIPKKDTNYWKPINQNFTVIPIEFKNYSFSEQVGFKHFLDNLSPDLVHFCMPQQPVFYTGAHVTTFHDLTLVKTYNSDKNWIAYHTKQLVGRFVFRRVVKTSQRILSPSQFTKNELVDFTRVDPNKIIVTYEAADIEKGSLSAYKHPYARYILYVGQQSDYKNIRRLASAHQRLIKKYPDLGLILVGKKDKSTLQNEVYFKNKHYTNILFTGFIPNAQRDWLYTNTAAYIFPSLMEGFGLPGLEAMGYGAPVVSSNTTCLPEIYGQAAHYFNPNDTSDIARAIDEVVGNVVLSKELRKLGYSQLKKYSWEKMAKQTHDVYLEVLHT